MTEIQNPRAARTVEIGGRNVKISVAKDKN
jgi:hypothetical protein